MSKEPKPGVIGSLPRTRPHRRSDKRAAPPSGAPPLDTEAAEPAVVKAAAPAKVRAAKKPAVKAAAPAKARAAKKPAVKPRVAKPRPAAPPRAGTHTLATPPPPAAPEPGVLETAVQAAAELAEIGLHAGARALRRAVSRLPRP